MIKPRAFTLIELLIGLGILGVLSVVLLSAWFQGIENITSLNFTQERASAFFDMYNRVGAYSRVAVAFPASYGGYSSGPTTLIMKIAGQADDGLDCRVYDYIVYDYAAGTLHEIIIPDPLSKRQAHDSLVATNLKDVTFTQDKTGPDDHRTVTLAAEAERKTLSSTTLQSQSQSIVARND